MSRQRTFTCTATFEKNTEKVKRVSSLSEMGQSFPRKTLFVFLETFCPKDRKSYSPLELEQMLRTQFGQILANCRVSIFLSMFGLHFNVCYKSLVM